MALAPWAAAFTLEAGSPIVIARAPRLLAITASDALILEAILITFAAPLAGVAIASCRRDGALASLVAAAGAFVAVSLLAGLAVAAAGGADVAVILQGRAALMAVALALGALGALCASIFRDVLDAAACALLITVTAAGGLLAAGPASADLSESAIDAGLLASPLVAVTSASQIDLLRTGTLYRLSPISHRRFAYPEWWSASAWYLLVAGGCAAGMAYKRGNSRDF